MRYLNILALSFAFFVNAACLKYGTVIRHVLRQTCTILRAIGLKSYPGALILSHSV